MAGYFTQPDGRYFLPGPQEHGPTRYTVVLSFTDDYEPRTPTPDPEHIGSSDNPWHWDWAGLISQPDARVEAVIETPNPTWKEDQ